MDLREKILFEYHDSAGSGHSGRERTYVALSRDFYWNHMYRSVRHYVKKCEVCQRTKPSLVVQTPLKSLPVPTDCWTSVSMDFIFGYPLVKGCNGILVFVCRFSKMVHLVAVHDSIASKESTRLFVDLVFRLHGMPSEIVSDRDPRFTAIFWRYVFKF
ncbi:MAG: transposase family protein, partial [Herbaspirillum sp.]|nr:transposase family protein [Herbaspirillum sp.]